MIIVIVLVFVIVIYIVIYIVIVIVIVILGWRYLSDATCLARAHLFSTALLV